MSRKREVLIQGPIDKLRELARELLGCLLVTEALWRSSKVPDTGINTKPSEPSRRFRRQRELATYLLLV